MMKLVSIKARNNENYGLALHTAVKEGNIEAIKLLLQRGEDINVKDKKGLTPLHWAAGHDYLEVVKLLIEKGADIHAKANNGWTPVRVAAFNDSKEVVKFLIENGANPNDIKKICTVKSSLTRIFLMSAAMNLYFILMIVFGKQVLKYYKDILHPYYDFFYKWFLIVALLSIIIFNLIMLMKLLPIALIGLKKDE